MKWLPAVLLIGARAAAAGRGTGPQARRKTAGRACGSCHALGRGDSADKNAPAFRTLGRRYPIEILEEALAEGFLTGHPAMPEFQFDADDVGAIIAYLKSIQQR